jgi:hypothetical protein
MASVVADAPATIGLIHSTCSDIRGRCCSAKARNASQWESLATLTFLDIETRDAVLRVQREIAEGNDSRLVVEATEATVKVFASSKAPLDGVAQAL